MLDWTALNRHHKSLADTLLIQNTRIDTTKAERLVRKNSYKDGYTTSMTQQPNSNNALTQTHESTSIKDSDESLMLAYANDDMRAFETLYRRHKDPLLRFFLRQMGSRAQAEELFQETWQSIIRNRERYRVDAKFTTYLYQVARSRLIDHYRKSGAVQWQEFDEQHQEVETTQVSEPDDAVDIIDRQQVRQLLIQAIQSLPPAQREVITLRFETTLTLGEIAQTVDTNTEAVKSRLRYAIKKLHEQLREQLQSHDGALESLTLSMFTNPEEAL